MKHLKTITILFILSLFTLISLTTCKKYPQDDKLSFETPDKRIRRQAWVLTSCLVDGIDVTDKEYTQIYNPLEPIDTVDYVLRNATLEFQYSKTRNSNGKMEKNYTVLFAIRNIIRHHYIVPTAGLRYEFNNYKRQVLFDTNDKKKSGNGIYYSDFPLLFNYTNEPWTIKKLIKTELIIETINSDGNKVKVTFKGQY